MSKSTLAFLISGLFLMGLAFTACEKDEEEEDFLGSVTVQLELADGLGEIPLANVNVSLISIADNVERKALADASGLAEFTDIPAGNYNLNVMEPREEGEYTLTGTKSNVVVQMQENTHVVLTLDAINPDAGLVIKEVYFVGAADNFSTLFKDQFVEIFNNSSETIYADGLYLAVALPQTPTNNAVNMTEHVDLDEYVYAEMVDQIPGNGTDWPIEPGGSLVIALNAINFKEDNPFAEFAVDNSHADLERYTVQWMEDRGRNGNPWFDFDNPDVPNMTNIFYSQQGNVNHTLYLMNVPGPSKFIFWKEDGFTEADVFLYEFQNAAGADRAHELLRVPTELIVDGIDVMENAEDGAWKSLPESIDASFTYLKADGNAYYSSMSLRRKIDTEASARFGRVVLQNTKNSFNDFEAIDYPDARGYDDITF